MLQQNLKDKMIEDMDLLHGCYATIAAAPDSLLENDQSSSALTFFEESAEMKIGLYRINIDQCEKSGMIQITLQTPFCCNFENEDYRLKMDLMQLKDWINSKILINTDMVLSFHDYERISLKMCIERDDDFYLPAVLNKMYPAYAASYVRSLKIIHGVGISESDLCSPDEFFHEYEYFYV